MLYDDKKFIGSVIRNARRKKNLRQAQLAEQVGMSEKNLGNIETGKQYPQVNNFLRLIETLNLTLEDFGTKTFTPDTSKRDFLLEEIYLASDKELLAFTEILKTIKQLNY